MNHGADHSGDDADWSSESSTTQPDAVALDATLPVADVAESGIVHSDSRRRLAAFMEVYHRLDRYVFSVLWKYGFRDDAMVDAMQDVFLEVWKDLPKYDPSRYADPRLWVLGITRNTARTHLRRVGRLVFDDSIEASTRALDERYEAVHEALEQMNDVERRVLLLFEVEELTARDISLRFAEEGFDCPPRKVYSILEDARRHFRAYVTTPPPRR